MSYMIEISESDKEKMTSLAEKLHKASKQMLMCLEKMEESEMGMREEDDDTSEEEMDEEAYPDDEMGMRDMGMRTGMRSGMGRRMGQRSGMGMRRGVKGTGRYSRYR